MPDPTLADPSVTDTLSGAAGGAGTGLVMLLAALKIFARPADINAAEMRLARDLATLEAKMAQTYISKDAIQPIMESLEYIRERLDRLADRQGGIR